MRLEADHYLEVLGILLRSIVQSEGEFEQTA